MQQEIEGLRNTAPAPALGKDFSFQFTYEHNAARAAKQDSSYRYAALPPEIDLSRRGEYLESPASSTIPGLDIPGGAASVTIKASRVEWGVTIPVMSRNRENAVAFLALLLGPAGRDALTTNGPTPVLPAQVTAQDYDRVPRSVRSLTTHASR